MASRIKALLVRLVGTLRPLLRALGLETRVKGWYELWYWRLTASKEGGEFANDWYERIYTDGIDVPRSFYSGKRILDIGCGPRGSLEWADDAADRVGLDPLVSQYRRFDLDKHEMRYVDAPAEDMPFDDGSFDVVLSLNSFDHVDDIVATAAEVSRVTADGGTFVLLVEIHHDATVAEPHRLDWDVVDLFRDDFDIVDERQLEQSPERRGVSAALSAGIPYDHGDTSDRTAALAARMVRKPRPSG